MTALGLIFPPDLPPEDLRAVALAADGAGVDELWLWEDCFKESGVAPAAAVLAWTERIAVGIGLLPVPLRNVAITAMEIATLERLFPGRFLPGIGHGVLDWMGQVGARAESPMTLLREYTVALRDLLHGATVTTDGRYVHLDGVALDWPPSPPPPLYVGAVKPKTVALAGELADGLILTGETTVEQLRAAVTTAREAADAAGRPAPDVVCFVALDRSLSAQESADRIGKFAAAGATRVPVLGVGDDGPPLAEFALTLGREVAPLLR